MSEKEGLYAETLNSPFFSAIIFNQKVFLFLQKEEENHVFHHGHQPGKKEIEF